MKKSKLIPLVFFISGIAAVLLGLFYLIDPLYDNELFIRQTGWIIIAAGVSYGLFYLLRYRDALQLGMKKYLFSTIAIIIGSIIITFSSSLAATVSYVLAGYAIWLGLLQFWNAMQMEGSHTFLWAIGTLSLLLGILIIWNPFENLKLGYIIGIYACILGGWLIYKGFNEKSSH